MKTSIHLNLTSQFNNRLYQLLLCQQPAPERLAQARLRPHARHVLRPGPWILTAGFAAILCLASLSVRATTLAYWQFEPADLGADSSGNGNTLWISNVTSSADVAANAPGTGSAVFDGSTSFALTASTLDLSAYPAITIECFVKTNGQSTLGMVYEHSTNNNVAQAGFYFDFNEPVGSVKTAQGSSPYAYITAPYPTNTAGWHHYAVVIDESGPTTVQKIYIDGVLKTPATTSLAYSRRFRNDLFFIGERGNNIAGTNGSFRFRGQIDELRISGRALPPSGFLIAPPLVNAAIGITQQPTNTVVVAYHPVVFSVAATLTNGDPALLEYQWRTNGVPVPGAIASTFTWALPWLADEGALVSVVISVPSVGGVTPVTSANATLHVTADAVPPVATAAFAQATTVVGMLFDAALDPVSATNAALYTLDGGATVESAQLLSDSTTVVLGVSTLTAPTYTVSYTVSDLAGNWATNTIQVTNMGFTAVTIGNVPPNPLLITTNLGGFTVIGGGQDIWTANDGFHFVYKQISGDFDMRLRVLNVGGGTGSSVRGGLMVRESLDANSRNVCMLSYAVGNNNWVATWRPNTGATTVIPGAAAAGNYGLTNRGAGFRYPNAWVRLKRSGTTISAYYSTNNLDWKQCSTNLPLSGLPDAVMVGMASDSVSATVNGTFQYADYQQFFLTNGMITISTQPTNTSVLAYRPVTFYVGAVLQGNPDQNLLSYQWSSNGVPIEGANATSFTFALPAPSDSGTQFRCLVSAPGVAPVNSAAATLTVQPDTNAPAALWAYSPDSHNIGIGFDELLDPNTANNPGLYGVDGGFNVLSAQLQADGKTVLLSVDGLNAPQFQLTLSGVADLSGNPANSVVVGNNAGLTVADINNGLLIPAQMVAVDNGGLTISAAGQDIWTNQDSFNFIYQSLTNDFDLRLQFVNSTPLRNASQRGGLMVRQDASQGSPNVFVGTYAPGGVAYWVVTERPTQDATTIIDAYPAREAAFAFPNAWLRLKRAGQEISAFESLDGFHWVQLGTNITDIAFSDPVLVGIASTPVSTLAAQFQYSNFGPTIPIPQLGMQLAGTNALLTWPTNATGFSLQQAPTLAGGTWTAVTNAPVQSGTLNQVSLPLTGSATFYRLIH